MADTVGAIASSLANNAPRVAAVSSPAAKAPIESLTQAQVQPVSPTLRVDPAAGIVITEYFNSSGEVQTQLPSKAAVAYMRMGLSPSGVPLEKTEAPSAAKSERSTNEILA